jgi:hypothetical protein
MTQQPLCRFCGGKIRKRVRTVWLYTPSQAKGRSLTADDYSRHVVVDELPRSKQDCMRLTNQAIVSVSRGWADTDGYITRFNEWDGESYVDPFFCNGDHARKFAYAAARAKPDLAMRAYHMAMREREQIEEVV